MGGIASNDRDTLALTRWIEHRDPEAFTELVGRYADMVYATCRRVLGDASEAEDAAQECFEGLARYEGAPPAHLGPWLHGAATNLALKRIRSRVRRRQREKAYAATRPEADAPYWDDVYGYVDEAIAALPADLREPLVAHFLESRTHQAIADAFGIPRGTVTYRINRGVQEVRKALGRRGIAITIPLLSALLSAPADAAPAAVTATLGKLAVSGVRYGVHGAGAATAAKVAAAGGILAMKKAVSVVVVVACAAVLFGGYWAFTRSRGQDVPPPIEGGVYEAIGQRPAPPAPAAAPPAEPNPGDIVAAKDAGPESDPNAFYLDKTALLHGRVVLDDGSPVPGCAVRVEHDPWSESPIRAFTVETTTDDNGEFAFDELPTASDRSEFEGLWLSYHVTAEADNLSAYRRMAFSTLELDQYVELVLHPGAVLAGVVRDQDGLPVAGAEVSRGLAGVPAAAGASAPFDRLYYGTDLRPVRSALDGTFALNRLLPGTYRLRVKADGYVTLTTGAYATDNDSIEIVLYRGGSISGTVVDAATGEGLSGLTVYGKPSSARFPSTNGSGPYGEDVSDEAGRFTFGGLRQGEYSFEVTAFTDNSPKTLPATAANVLLLPGQDVTGVQILVSTGGGIEGRLLAKGSGRPIPFTPVHINRDGPRYRPVTLTDGAGCFSFTNIEPGTWYIGDKHLKQTYSLTVVEGQVLRGVDVYIDLAGAIRGRVTDAAGAPLAGATVVAQDVKTPSSLVGASDAAGEFALTGFALPTDCYIQARHATGVSPRLGPLRCAAGGLDDIDLEIQAPCRLAGRVVDRSGRGVSSVVVTARPKAAGSLLALHPTERGSVYAPDSVRWRMSEETDILALTGVGGRFDFGRLVADTYLVSVVAEKMTGDQTVTLGPGEQKTNVELVVDGPGFGALEGVVRMGGAPVAAATVLAHTEQAVTDGHGHYRIESIPAGDVIAYAYYAHSAEGYEVKREASCNVTISAYGTARADFDVAAGTGTLEGYVTMNGLPAFGAPILGEGFSAYTNPEGYYRAEGVPSGPTTLKLDPPAQNDGIIHYDRFMYTKEVDIAAAGVTRVDFNIGGGKLQGQVAGILPGEVCDVAVIPGEVVVDTVDVAQLQALEAQIMHRCRLRADGAYDFPYLPPGLYTVFAVAYPADSADYAQALAGMHALYEFVEAGQEEVAQIDFVFE